MVRLFRAECYEGKQANRSSEIRFKSGGKISKMEAEAKNQEQETDDEGENMREQVEAIENDLAAGRQQRERLASTAKKVVGKEAPKKDEKAPAVKIHVPKFKSGSLLTQMLNFQFWCKTHGNQVRGHGKISCGFSARKSSRGCWQGM